MSDGHIGRAVTLTWGGAVIPGVREKGITLNGESINVTSDEDNGYRTLLDVSAEDMIDISVSGVTKSQNLKTDWFAGNRTQEIVITYPGGESITGTFYMGNYVDTGPYNDAMTFTASFQSTGTFTYVPAP